MNRNAIIKHIDLWKSKLGSYSAVARKCNINPGALSTILQGKYGADENTMLQRIARALDYRENTWQIEPSINNYRVIEQVYSDAKTQSMWFAISNKAGSGKTATMEDIFNRDQSGTVTFIQAEEWSGRQFLQKLVAKTVGELDAKYRTIAELMDIVVNYFNDMSLERPVLLIDEADKLKPGALRTLIPLYNRTEHRLGVILSGTENLEKEIKAGVRIRKKGYDELESRIGRTYINLRGATKEEVYKICQTNGIVEGESMLQIWNELEKVPKMVKVKTDKGYKDIMIDCVEDFRRLMRLVKRELLINQAA
jgi:DNA transposition AAA+ family ATPase